MVGRTPEYLGKKIESYDVKLAMLYVLIFPLLILVLTAVSVLSPTALAGLNNTGRTVFPRFSTLMYPRPATTVPHSVDLRPTPTITTLPWHSTCWRAVFS